MKDILLLILAVIVIIYNLISGVRDIKNRKIINNTAVFILSIGKIAISIVSIIGIILMFLVGKLKF